MEGLLLWLQTLQLLIQLVELVFNRLRVLSLHFELILYRPGAWNNSQTFCLIDFGRVQHDTDRILATLDRPGGGRSVRSGRLVPGFAVARLEAFCSDTLLGPKPPRSPKSRVHL